MVGLEEFSPLSEKLLGYFEMIEKETGCQIVLRYIDWDDENHSEAWGDFKVGVIASSSTIELEVNRNNGLSKADLEYSLAHEATHGYLVNAKGFCRAYLKQHTHERYLRELATIISSMVDDIIVSKTMADHVLSPFASTYLADVKREIKEARKDPGYYPFYPQYPEFTERFLASRYVLAWGFLKYIDLPRETRDLLGRFIKGTQNISLPAYKTARRVTEIISGHDIFTPQGHRTALEEIIRLWDLDDMINLWEA